METLLILAQSQTGPAQFPVNPSSVGQSILGGLATVLVVAVPIGLGIALLWVLLRLGMGTGGRSPIGDHYSNDDGFNPANMSVRGSRERQYMADWLRHERRERQRGG